jgi:hypothetical protein
MRSVTTKKITMNFKQQNTDLNAERKKNAQLEQRLREMEADLAAGYIREPPPTIKPNYPNANITISMAAPPSIQETNLATPTIINTDLPPPLVIILPMRAVTPRMRWVGGTKCAQAAFLLQVGIGGERRTPLWRNIGQS